MQTDKEGADKSKSEELSKLKVLMLADVRTGCRVCFGTGPLNAVGDITCVHTCRALLANTT